MVESHRVLCDDPKNEKQLLCVIVQKILHRLARHRQSSDMLMNGGQSRNHRVSHSCTVGKQECTRSQGKGYSVFLKIQGKGYAGFRRYFPYGLHAPYGGGAKRGFEPKFWLLPLWGCIFAMSLSPSCQLECRLNSSSLYI